MVGGSVSLCEGRECGDEQLKTWMGPGPASARVTVRRTLELQTNLREDYAKFYNRGEGTF